MDKRVYWFTCPRCGNNYLRYVIQYGEECDLCGTVPQTEVEEIEELTIEVKQ